MPIRACWSKMAPIPKRRNLRAFAPPACAAVFVSVVFAGCARAAPPGGPDPLPEPRVRSLAAYGAAMLHILDAQSLENADPRRSIEHWNAAAATLERARAADPENPHLVQLLAACHIRLGRFDDAVKVAEPLVRSGEIDPKILIHIVATLVRLRDFQRAADLAENYLNQVEDLTAIAPSQLIEELAELYGLDAMRERGIAFLSGLLEANPENGQLCRVLIALLDKDQSDEKATTVAGDFLARNPEDARVRVVLSQLHLKADRRAEAAAELNRLLEADDLPLDVRLTVSHVALGLAVEADTGPERERSLALLERVLADAAEGFSDRLVSELQLRAASLHVELKQFDKARELLEVLAARPGANWRVHAALADMFWKSGKKDEALAHLRNYAAGLLPADDLRRIRMVLADFLERNGDREGAVAQLRENLTEEPKDPDTSNHLGYLFALWGQNLDEAVALVKTALEAEPENAAYLDSLGWAYYKLALQDDNLVRLREAGALIEKALKEMPDDPTINQHMGDIYFVEGRLQDALANWRKAIENSEPASDRFPERARVIKNVEEVEKILADPDAPARPLVRPLKPPSDLPEQP